jgi:hypothetical protein
MPRRKGLKPANELCLDDVRPRDVLRFASKVGEPDANGCWPWLGRRDKNGYGLFCYRRQWMGAHRFAHALLKGIVPRLRHVHHTDCCHRRDCVNPQHLEHTTKKYNDQDGTARRKRQAAALREQKPDPVPAAGQTDDIPF